MKNFILRIIMWLGNRNLLNFISDKLYLKMCFYLTFDKKLDINHPQTFNEKMQWLKINDRKEEYIKYADKYEVKKFISDTIGEEYLIPTLWAGDNPDEIPFSDLPDKFVIKCNHGSHCNIICKDKNELNIKLVKKQLRKWVKMNWFGYGREWPYKMIKPKILIEKYMKDNNTNDLNDYKFFCFNGHPKYILVCSDRYNKLKETFFDLNWNVASFKRPNHEIDDNIKKPNNLKLMINLATKLSKSIPFSRIDFYEINGNVYFGEITFYPASGLSKFDPEEWDYKLGKLIKISSIGESNEK